MKLPHRGGNTSGGLVLDTGRRVRRRRAADCRSVTKADGQHDLRRCQGHAKTLLWQIAQGEVAHRPGRIDPRVLKRRRHRDELRQDSRATLRAEFLNNRRVPYFDSALRVWHLFATPLMYAGGCVRYGGWMARLLSCASKSCWTGRSGKPFWPEGSAGWLAVKAG